jgi:hypothetical protein
MQEEQDRDYCNGWLDGYRAAQALAGLQRPEPMWTPLDRIMDAERGGRRLEGPLADLPHVSPLDESDGTP